MTQSVVVEKVMPHPPEKIWRALTQSALLADWMMENDFRPEVGCKFNFRREPVGEWNGVVDCEVLAVEPHRLLAYRWSPSGDETLETVVTWTLTPAEGGTRLRMEQSGFGPGQERNFAGARYGWQKMMASLETVLARPD